MFFDLGEIANEVLFFPWTTTVRSSGFDSSFHLAMKWESTKAIRETPQIVILQPSLYQLSCVRLGCSFNYVKLFLTKPRCLP